MAEEKIYGVQEINDLISRGLRHYIPGTICVEGEVVDYRSPDRKGHRYFKIREDAKDIYGTPETNVLSCALWSGVAGKILKFEIENGQRLRLHGEISLYRPTGSYSFKVTGIEKIDEMDKFYKAFEEMRKRLLAEGLFDEAHKKPLPPYPARIGVVTSEQGQAIKDIYQNIHLRNPYVRVILFPVQVQGEGAAASVAQGIRMMDRAGMDLIIVGRGGGSIQDLWAFNEEAVARAIYEADTPIISAVGHEGDTTIADFVADVRVSTPTGAAAAAVPLYTEIEQRLASVQQRYKVALGHRLDKERYRVEAMRGKLKALSPEAKLARQKQEALRREEMLRNRMERTLRDRQKRYQLLTARIDAGAPSKKLMQGYGYLESKGTVVSSVTQLNPGDTLKVTLKDGSVETRVEKIDTESRI